MAHGPIGGKQPPQRAVPPQGPFGPGATAYGPYTPPRGQHPVTSSDPFHFLAPVVAAVKGVAHTVWTPPFVQPAAAKGKPKAKPKAQPPYVSPAAGNSAPDQAVTRPISPPKPTKGTPGKTNAAPTPTKGKPSRSSANGGTTPAAGSGAGTSFGSTYAPMSAADVAKLAKQWATTETNALSQPYTDAINQTNTQELAHEQAISGFGAALGNILAPVGSNVANMYGTAADAIAQYGQGFSAQNAQLKQDAGANASTANPNLTAAQQAEIAQGFQGQPQDVMYGLNGYNPATSLRAVGTDIGANMSQTLPLVANNYGQEWLANSRSVNAKAVQDLQTKMAEARGNYPKLFQDAMTTINDQGMKQQSLAATLYAEGIRSRTAMAGMLGYDPATGLPTAKTVQNQTANTLAEKKYAVQLKSLGLREGSLRLQYIKEQETLKNKGRYKGLTSDEYQRYSALALGAARNYHAAWTDGKGNQQAALAWQKYLTAGLQAKIPMWILIQQGRRVYSQREVRQNLLPGQGSDK